ncbi:hypothetical protein [Parasphingorhabdus halotolerans]|uniref:hypothetical protein n=1 Tax=Parasphingorhabdus halotolerans TaxID=2725558 RepID=UPI001B3A3DC6|nr:hypothetical protein [Parasphingorhabdus halotolerans]
MVAIFFVPLIIVFLDIGFAARLGAALRFVAVFFGAAFFAAGFVAAGLEAVFVAASAVLISGAFTAAVFATAGAWPAVSAATGFSDAAAAYAASAEVIFGLVAAAAALESVFFVSAMFGSISMLQCTNSDGDGGCQEKMLQCNINENQPARAALWNSSAGWIETPS